MNTLEDLATKKDVEEIVGRVVGEIVGDALQLIAAQFDGVNTRFEGIDQRFDKVDQRFDKQDAEIKEIKSDVKVVKKDIAKLNHTALRIDNRLDALTVVQENHGMRIKKLEEKFA